MKPLVLIVMVVLAACTRETAPSPYVDTTLILGLADDIPTRADMPDEVKTTDWNLLIFNAFGDLEEHVYVPSHAGYSLSHTTRLLREVPYTIIATANLGYQLPIHCLSDALEYRYRLVRPEDYRQGIPMAVVLEEVLVTEQMSLQLERLMARMDLRMDRRELEADVLLKVTEVSIGNCPSSVSLFPGSGVETASQTFQQGFTLKDAEVDALNRDSADALSGTVSLYLLENVNPTHESFLEIKAQYHSPDYHTTPGEPLTYRVPLGEVRRNTVYPIIVSVSSI